MKIIIGLFQIQKSISENHKRNLKYKVEFPKYFKSYGERFSKVEFVGYFKSYRNFKKDFQIVLDVVLVANCKLILEEN